MAKKLILLLAVLCLGLLAYGILKVLSKSEALDIPDPAFRNTQAPEDRPQVLLAAAANLQPMNQLLLINFEKDPDPLYYGFELMYLDSKGSGQGYRVIGYRHDGYADYYDSPSLKLDSKANLSVTGKGVKHHQQVDLGPASLKLDDHGVQAYFSFEDVQGRQVSFSLEDRTGRPRQSMDILAPVGVSSQDPQAFPLIYLYDFDFVPLRSSRAQLTIGDRSHQLDPFPVPLPFNGRRRSFLRYSFDAYPVDLFPTDVPLQRVVLDDDLSYRDALSSYYFSYEDSHTLLQEIVIRTPKPITVRFDPAIGRVSGQGTIYVLAQEGMGPLIGSYQVLATGDSLEVQVHFDQGWLAQTSGLISKMVLASDQSVFKNWPKDYYYTAQLDLTSHDIQAQWVNQGAVKSP